MKSTLLIFCGMLCLCGLLPVAKAETIDFAHQVVPILKRHCVECHGGKESKGGFSLNTRRLFLEGEVAIPGNADESYIFELMVDPDPDFRMPQDAPPVPEDEMAVLKQWVDQGMVWEPGFTFGEPTYDPPLRPRTPELPEAVKGRNHPIDRIIDTYLIEYDLPRPEPIDDATFLRRVFLDIVGLLPNSEEARAFLDDPSPEKRAGLIDDLLSRDIEYAEHWLTFWNDLLRNDYDGTGFITGGRTQISAWLYYTLKENRSFEAIVRELIAPPNESSAGFINGIKWRGEVSAGQSLPIQFSQNISQSFLGINMKCASCHDSFIDRWTLQEAYDLGAIFSDEPMELVRCDKPTGVMASPGWPFPEIGQIDPTASKEERLQQLADLFVHPENGRVARTIANRLWAQFMGRGIVHPLDAMGTEPWNEDLLDWLASHFQRTGYDIKSFIRLMVTSQAYQSQSARTAEGENEAYVYRGPVSKRLTAEQYLDAIWQITDSAPAFMDAPIVRRDLSKELIEELSVSSSWIWGSSLDEGLPPNGESILAYREFKPTKPVRFASVVAAADLDYEVAFNGQSLFSGRGWRDLKAAVVTSKLSSAGNYLLVTAENGGSRPNSAGIFCAIRLEYEDGTHEIILTDTNWKVSPAPPDEVALTEIDPKNLSWESARIAFDTGWEGETNSRVGLVLAKAYVGRDKPVRASLIKNNHLMRALGRPNRDQIVTSRPSELTTLEAVNLSTSDQLFNYLREGASRLKEKANGDTSRLVEEVYLSLLTRSPSEEEERILQGNLGQDPPVDLVADLLWALVVTPDFFITR